MQSSPECVNKPQIASRAEFEAYKATVSGPKGSLTEVMKGMGKVPKEDKPAMGKLINEAKTAVTTEFDQVLERIEAAELAAKLGPAIDPTLPAPDADRGTLHPIAQVREEVVGLFRRIGFSVAEATEVETEHYCFDALNIPGDHPARDMQDSYYCRTNSRSAMWASTPTKRSHCCSGPVFSARHARCDPQREFPPDRRAVCRPKRQSARPQGDSRPLREDRFWSQSQDPTASKLFSRH